MKKYKIKLVIFEEPKIKLCPEENLSHFVDFYKINSMGYGIEHGQLAQVQTVQEVLQRVLSIKYVHNKPIKPGKVVGKLKEILLFDDSFLQDVSRIKSLIKKNKKVLLDYYKKKIH